MKQTVLLVAFSAFFLGACSLPEAVHQGGTNPDDKVIEEELEPGEGTNSDLIVHDWCATEFFEGKSYMVKSVFFEDGHFVKKVYKLNGNRVGRETMSKNGSWKLLAEDHLAVSYDDQTTNFDLEMRGSSAAEDLMLILCQRDNGVECQAHYVCTFQ